MDTLFKDISFYKRKRKMGIIGVSIAFVCIVICLTVLGLISNYQNYLPQKIICYIIAILCGWIDIFILFDIVLKNHFFIKKIKTLSLANKKEITGVVFQNDKIVTTSKYEKAYAIDVKDDEKKNYSLLFSFELGKCPFEVEKRYVITTANNWIVGFKEDVK